MGIWIEGPRIYLSRSSTCGISLRRSGGTSLPLGNPEPFLDLFITVCLSDKELLLSLLIAGEDAQYVSPYILDHKLLVFRGLHQWNDLSTIGKQLFASLLFRGWQLFVSNCISVLLSKAPWWAQEFCLTHLLESRGKRIQLDTRKAVHLSSCLWLSRESLLPNEKWHQSSYLAAASKMSLITY